MKRIAVILLFLFACGKNEPAITNTEPPPKLASPALSSDDARKTIQASMEFGEFQFTDAAYSMPVARSVMTDDARASAKALAKAGWVAYDGSGDVTLTDKARTDKRFILRPNGILDVVPLAKKEMGNVEAVRQNSDGTASADFTWRWIANDVGSSFLAPKFEGTHNATATLIWNGKEWSVLKIEPR